MKSILRFLVLWVLLALTLLPTETHAGISQYTESFDNGQYCDLPATTAWWDSTAGRISFHDFSMTMLSTVEGLGTTVDIKVQGDHAYMLSYTSLRIFDISVPDNPSALGSFSIPAQANDVEIAGHYAYVVSNGGYFIVIDISDPSSPSHAGFLAIASANDVFLDGNYAYVTSGTQGVHVVDISDPTNPVIVGSYNGFSDGQGIVVSGDIAFACSYSGGVRVLNISDPTAPTLIGSYSAGSIRDIAVEGNRVYIGVHNDGVRILDVSDPASPTLLGTFTSSYANGVAVSGNLLYISDWAQGVFVVDVSDPSAPAELLNYNKNARDICVAGTNVFTSAETSLDIFEVAEPILPALETGIYDTPGNATRVKVVGQYAYVADRTSGMHIIDISDRTNPILTGSIATIGDCWDVDVDGEYAYVAAYEDGVRIVDISDPQSPQLISTVNTTRAVGVDVEGNHLYVADYWNGMVAVDISDPVNPSMVGLYPASSGMGAAWSLVADGDFAFVTFTHSTDDVVGLRVLDISDPTNPTFHGYFDTAGEAQGIALYGDYAFIADSEAGVQVLDITNTASPQYVTTVSTTNAKAITITGDYAFVADLAGGVRVLDISNPNAPTILSNYDVADEAKDIDFSGEHLYVADQSDGIRILQVFQREFETLNNAVRSNLVDESDDEITGVRFSSTQTGSILWEVSADGGTNWQEVPDDNSWQPLSNPGSDLLWRSTLQYAGTGINSVATDLAIGWVSGEGIAQNIVVDGVNDFLSENLIDEDSGDTEYPQIDLGSLYISNNGDDLFIGVDYDRSEWAEKQVGIAISTGGPGGTSDAWNHAIAWTDAPHKPDYYAYCNIDNEWQELRKWNNAWSGWDVIHDGAGSLGWMNTSGFEEVGLSLSDLGLSAGDTIYIEVISTQDSETKGPLDLIAGDEDQLSAPDGSTWDVTEPVELDATIMYVIKEFGPGEMVHDDLDANTSDYYSWAENRIGWHAEEDGYISEELGSNSWNAAIVSNRSLDSAENPFIIFRFEHNSQSAYMFGFTGNPPGSNNFHYGNISHGLYLHTTGSLRYTWNVDHQIATLPGNGVYDLLIELDQVAGQVHFTIDDVPSYDSPISDFISPVFTSSQSRTISGDYNIQTNTYTNAGKIYDIWAYLDPAYVPAPGSIAGSVTTDCSYGMSGLEGVVISAYNVPAGDLIGTDTTDASGYYQITDMVEGDYDLTVVPPTGFTADPADTTASVLYANSTTMDLAVNCPVMDSISSFSSDWSGLSGLLPEEACSEWLLNDTATPEDPVISGDILTLSTTTNSHFLHYWQQGANLLIPDTLVIEFQMRFESGAEDRDEGVVPVVGLTVDSNQGAIFYIGQDEIFLMTELYVKGESAFVDTDSTFHWYRIEVYDKDSIRIYYDSELMLTGSIGTDTRWGEDQIIYWGDSTPYGHGTSEWKDFRHNAGECTALTNDLIVTGPVSISSDTTFTSLTIIDGGILTADASITISNSLTIESGGLLTHSPQYLEGLNLQVGGTLEVEAGGGIDVSVKGLRGGSGVNDAGETYDENDNIVAGVPGAVTFAPGASYGGRGGDAQAVSNEPYGTLEDPRYLGSGGGGATAATGGGGGGMVRITAPVIIIDGDILASGGNGVFVNGVSGAGSGGSIRLDAGTLSGTGSIAANGGQGVDLSNGDSGSGGGGRIAVYYDEMTFPQENILALGGSSGVPGTDGTMILESNNEPPEITLTVGPTEGGYMASSPYSLCWSATDNSTSTEQIQFSYKMDDGAYSAWGYDTCVTYEQLTEGTHQFVVKARDLENAENVLTRNFTVDLTLPETNIVSGPSSGDWSNSTDVTFTWTGSDNLTQNDSLRYSYKIDCEPWSGYSQELSHAYTDLSDSVLGGNSGQALLFDGNDDVVFMPEKWISGIDDSWTLEAWIYPTAYPSSGMADIVRHSAEGEDKFIGLMPDGQLRFGEYYSSGEMLEFFSGYTYLNEWVHIAFVSTPGQLEIYINSARAGTLEKVYGSSDWDTGYEKSYFGRNVPDGEQAFSGMIDEVRIWNVSRSYEEIGENMLRPVDSAAPGLVGYWKMDNSDPIVVKDYSATGNHGILGLSLAWDIYEPEWVESDMWGPSGTHMFQVKARDLAGLETVIPAYSVFVVDIVDPETEITGGPGESDTVGTHNVTIEWTGTDDKTPVEYLRYSFRLDGGDFGPTVESTSYLFEGLTDGSHTVEVYAADWALNHDQTPAFRTFIVDTQSPAITLLAGPEEGMHVSQADQEFMWTASDAVSPDDSLYYSYRLDTLDYTAWLRGDTSVTFEGLDEGPHQFDVRARDENDHISSIVRNFLVDLTPPATALTAGPSEGDCWPQYDVTFTWTGTDNLTGTPQLLYSFSMDSDTFTTWSPGTGHTYSSVAQGSHTFTVLSRDLAGHIDPGTAIVTFTVGTNDLVSNSITVPDSAFCGQGILVELSARNAGTCPISVPWQDCIYLVSDSPVISIPLGCNENTSILGPGDSYTFSGELILPDNISGEFWLSVILDHGNQVFEGGSEGNNTSYSSVITISIPPHPDLQVTNIAAPTEAWSGQGNYVEWTVGNLGAAAATGGWKDYVYLSDDDQAGNDIKLSEFTYSYPLDTAADYTHIHPVVFPEDISGDYWIIVCTDAVNTVHEYEGETDNCAVSAAFAISLTPSPNLVVSSIQVPASANTNDDLELSWVVENTGGAPTSTPAWFDRVYLSTDSIPDGTYLSEFANPAYLPIGGQYVQQNKSVHIPKDIPEGTYYMIVVTDSRNNVDEKDAEDDNVKVSTPFTINYVPYPRPDLAVTNVVVPAMGWAGNNISVSWTVENVGDAAASAGGQPVDWVVFSTDSIADPHERIYLGGDIIGQPLDPSESYTKTVDVPVPIGSSGQYYVFIWTDVDLYFDDPELTNNFSEIRPIFINIPPLADLAVTSISASSDTVTAGTTLGVQWVVTNEGAGPGYVANWSDGVYLSTDTNFDPGSDFRALVHYHSGMVEPDHSYNTDVNVSIPADITGQYYVFTSTDIYDNVDEGEFESNNWQMRPNPIQVISPPSADLQVTLVETAGMPMSGEQLTISWTVENFGPNETTTSSWTDYLYMSQDSVFSAGSSTHMASASHTGLLHLAESYQVSRIIILPEGISGAYYFHVVTDASGYVYEADAEGNNVGSAGVQVMLTPPPDLRVASVQAEAEVTAGDRLPLQWTVRNDGTGVTKQTIWKDSFYLSSDTLYGGGDTYVAGFTHSGELDPNEFYQDNRDITIPAGYSGEYFVIARTDADGQVYEYQSDGNNESWTSVLVNSPPPDSIPVIPPPDLVITQIDFIDGPADTIVFTVENQSPNHPQTAESYWIDRFYLSQDVTLNTGTDVLTASLNHVDGLPPGESYTVTKEVELPDGTEGDFYLFGVADQTARVTESEEANNTMMIPVTATLTVPDLSVASVTADDTLYAGQPVDILWSVINEGAGPGGEDSWYDGVYLSMDQILDETDYNLGAKQHAGDLAASASYNDSYAAVIPNGLTGKHYFFVKTDKNDNVYEHDREDNNITFTQEGVEIFVLPPDYDLVVSDVVMPDTAIVGEDMTISWVVANTGESNLSGQWLDAVYISADTLWDINDGHLGNAVRQLGLGTGQSYRQMLTVAAEDFFGLLDTGVPGLQPGNYYILVMTDIYNQINEMDETNNRGFSASDIALDVTPLVLDVPEDSLVHMNGQQYYRLEYPQGQDLRFTVDIDHEFDEFELYLSFGSLPDRIDYERRYKIDAHEEIVVSSPDTNVCYLMIYGDYIVGSGGYEILAEAIFFGLTDLSPSVAGNSGFVRFDLAGGQLDQVTDVKLRNVGGHTLNAWDFKINRSTSLTAQVDLSEAELGFYDCIIYAGAADSSVLADAVEVQIGTEPAVLPSFEGPDAIRQLASIDYIVSLYNSSNADAHDVIHSITPDPGTEYQILHDLGHGEILIADGSTVYLYTDFIGVGKSAKYTIRMWGSDDTGMESITVEYDMILAQGSAKNLVMSTWVNPVIDEYASHVNAIGAPVDPIELWNGVVETWDTEIALTRSGSVTLPLYDKIEIAIEMALQYNEGTPMPVGGISDSGEIRVLLTDGTAVESGLLAAYDEAQSQYVTAKSSDKFKKKRKDITVRVARDPNEKFGPTAEGEENFVTQWQDLPYTIYFENVPTATAAAQNVVVTDQLDEDLDWRKLRLGEITFGEVVVPVPENHSYYHTTVSLESGYILEIDAGLNSTTGVVHWSFNTVDPATGLPPLDPNAGFLPPNDENGVGAGHVLFTIKADEDASNGTEITNSALIVFDDNDPIETQEVMNVLQKEYSDLEVIYASSSVDAPEFSEGAEVTISAAVFNSGDAPASNFDVAFYDGDPDAGGLLIETAELVNSILAGEEHLLDVTWRPERITGETRIYIVADPWGTEEELFEDNNDRMLSIVVEPRHYTVTLDDGVNMVSLPLEPAEPYSARSFATELGATMIIRYDSMGVFVPFILSEETGDGFEIGNTEGYIAVTENEHDVTYHGITHSNLVDYRQGMNFISLPLNPAVPLEAESLCVDIEADMIVRYRRDTDMFETFIPDFHDGPGFAITGASGYLANIGRSHSVHFEGSGWEGVRDYVPPPLMTPSGDQERTQASTVVMGITGRMTQSYWGEETPVSSDFDAKIRIARLDRDFTVDTETSTGKFCVAYVDYTNRAAICVGDTLLFSLADKEGREACEPQPYIVTEKDIGRRYAVCEIALNSMIPTASRLYQNFPNPFNPSTRVRFQVAKAGPVRIKVYNVAGQLVKTLVNDTRQTGYYEITWKGTNNNGNTIASGVYFCRMETPGYSRSMKVIVLR